MFKPDPIISLANMMYNLLKVPKFTVKGLKKNSDRYII